MNIVVMSDLHGNLININEKDCEVAVICGDISPLYIQSDIPSMKKWMIDEFLPWAENLNVDKVLFIGGNHDFLCEREDKWMHDNFSRSKKVTYLKNEFFDYISSTDYKVHRFYGTPYCKIFGHWAFMRNDDTLKEKFSHIPDNVDVLFSHDAPKVDKLGVISDGSAWNNIDAGNYPLANAILEHKPKYAFCGHIHSGKHEPFEMNGITFANTSIVNEKYKVYYKPLVINI